MFIKIMTVIIITNLKTFSLSDEARIIRMISSNIGDGECGRWLQCHLVHGDGAAEMLEPNRLSQNGYARNL